MATTTTSTTPTATPTTAPAAPTVYTKDQLAQAFTGAGNDAIGLPLQGALESAFKQYMPGENFNLNRNTYWSALGSYVTGKDTNRYAMLNNPTVKAIFDSAIGSLTGSPTSFNQSLVKAHEGAPVGDTPGTAYQLEQAGKNGGLPSDFPTTDPNAVNTNQPSPTTVNATPYTGSGPSATPNTPPTSDPLAALKAGFSAASASGAQPPQSQGQAASAINNFTPQVSTPSTNIEASLAQDPGYQQLLADRAQYTSVANQSGSLLDTYNKMISEAGIPKINEELLNTQKIIDGTEDDIRNEVTAAGGFATDSQVLALASARNKQLIKNYNNLLATKQMAQDQVNTMVNLAAQDRSFALDTITQKLQIDQQIIQYRDKFVQNAKEGYQNIISAVGYGGLYDMLKSDPSSLSLAEKTLGMQSGQLQNIVGYISNKTNLSNFANYSITSPYIVTAGGEVQNTQTGQGYTSSQDFQEKTGMTLEQAQAKGLIKPLGLTKEDQQRQFDNSIKTSQLNISRAQLGLEQQRINLEINKQLIDQRLTQAKDIQDIIKNNPGEWGKAAAQIEGIYGKIQSGSPIDNMLKAAYAPTSQQAQQKALQKDKIDSVSSLLTDKALNSTVGPNYASRFSIVNQLTGAKSNFIGGVEQLRSQLNLNSLINAKAQGATFGALSDQELQVLSNSATKLGSWAIKNANGQVTGYNANEKDFRRELDKINNFAKLDYILKGGSPTDVGVQQMGDGSYWTRNSDGTMTKIE